jgi:hypothetical protein
VVFGGVDGALTLVISEFPNPNQQQGRGAEQEDQDG